jgi:dipeptidyl aminopeptidase/acylaminoacyl peptidase
MNRFIITIAFCFLVFSINASEIPINNWLFSGTVTVQMPAFYETEGLDGKTFTEENLFRFPWIENDKLLPKEGNSLAWSNQQSFHWKKVNANEDGLVEWQASPKEGEGVLAYFASYLKTDRWGKINLEVQSRQRFEVFIGDKPAGNKYTVEKGDKDPGKWSKEIAFERGNHLILVRTIVTGNEEAIVGFSAKLKPRDYFSEEAIEISLNPLRTKTIRDVMEGVKSRGVSLSFDGKYYAANFSQALPGDKSENWTEIRNAENNNLEKTFRHSSIAGFQWGHAGNIYTYRTSGENKATIWLASVDKPEPKIVLNQVENLGFVRWAQNGEFLVFTVREQPASRPGDLKLVEGMEDRMPGFRSRNFLYMVNLKTGLKERLTHGYISTSLQDISPDGKYLLFAQSRPNYTESPFSLQNMYLMNIETREVDTLWTDNKWGGRCSFSPDGKFLLISAGPSLFDGIGENVPEGKLPNDFDTQLYIYELSSGKTDPITRDFDPSVLSSYWNSLDNNIYMTTADKDCQKLYRYNLKNRKFQLLETGIENITSVDFSGGKLVASCTGNNTTSPPVTLLLNLRDLKTRLLVDAEKETYRNVKFGKTKDWDFVSEAGVPITGRVYYPPDFDATRKYPVIVYYYGGTTPVNRSFAGRYPFNSYAGDGYLVYVLQPSGAIGYGQAFSAEHVNNWGITVADEIIEGTKLFLVDHPYADASRVGCMGASYGGFMTMLLMTRTDIFAASISHAGISSLSSYWGEGYWGYSYSAGASRDSYPWNNRSLYVDQSPLFSADKVVTPMLLLHGASDTNVPVGESIQMFTALKILGKPVELIEVRGEDHHILTVSKRYAWHNTIMAWFDKWLKGEGEWWEELYPKRNL